MALDRTRAAFAGGIVPVRRLFAYVALCTVIHTTSYIRSDLEKSSEHVALRRQQKRESRLLATVE